ncbi:GIY-YIG nuclease family protein [Maribacter sp. 2210JD10-5]|uniref:GIY-YIG nuclease family protein n=1 Tax=Maribacter sp. 2210JD10-5 TaxID=3386272 RepID=UPI0039BCC417
MKGYCYILTNKNETVLYIGATNDIHRRMNEHKHRIYPNAFTKRYNCDILVYFEEFDNVKDAFKREKQLKAGNRKRKEELINSINPEWNDLALNWVDKNFLMRNKK